MKNEKDAKEAKETLKDNDETLETAPFEDSSDESEKETVEEEMRPDNSSTEAKSPEQKEAEYRQEIKQQEDRYLRLAAEFDNYKKRTARQFDEIIKGANEDLIVQILEIIDNFQRALGAAEGKSDYKALHKGTELIYQQFCDILNKEGVEKIEAVGKPFDPQLHDAMMRMESSDYAEGIIVMELVTGYKLKGKVIRHSKVAVSSGQSNK